MAVKKRTYTSAYTYVVATFLTVLGILGIVLIFECRYFHMQAHALCELKEDYSRYVAALKKIMSDYNKTKERLDLLESYLENEKKNGNPESGIQDLTGAKLGGHFLSLFGNTSQDDEFVLINRDLPYLRRAALEFIVQEYSADFIYSFPEEAWFEYSNLLIKDSQTNLGKPFEKRASTTPRRRAIKKKRVNGMPLSSDMLFLWPVERSKCWLSSLFGPRSHANGQSGFHYGLDMAALRGTPVKASSSGIVIEARFARGYGKTILISHNQKYKTRYAHLDKIYVSVGQKVNRGAVIGLVGSTGNVRVLGKDGSHLHFEVYTFNRRVNPLYFLMD